ncbi:MAG: PAS domain S-box protein [Deltaproteobacteria bacterium]|nr:PAS domain S-box protein [Deltaproteobacteria bacterium]
MPKEKKNQGPPGSMDSKELLRLFIRYTPAAVALCDTRMRYLAYSRRWIIDYNLPDEDLVGRCHYDVFPETPAHWKEEHRRCFSGEVIRKEEEPFPRADGSLDWVRRELHPWHDADGRVGGLVMFAEVITERKKAQDEVNRSRERLHKLFHANPHGITLSTLKDGRYIEVNQAFLDQVGWPREEVIGRTSMDIGLWADPDDRERAMKITERTGRLRNFEVMFCRKGGERFPCEWTVEVTEVDGEPCILSVLTDISEREKAEAALRDSEEKYRIIVENANDVIFIAQDGLLKFPNPKTAELLGLPLEDIENTPFPRYIHPDDRDMVIENHRKRLAGEPTPQNYAFRVLRSPDEVRTVQISAVLTEWEGKPATLNFIRDVTEQKKLETQLQQAQRLEAIGTLAGGIAHDFNNLLMGIQGNTSLLMMELDREHPHQSRLRDIQAQVKRGAELTQQLLGFARGGKYEVRPTDPNRLVSETCGLFARTRKEIRIHEKYQEEIWPVAVDRTQMEQVLLNIFVNAWQAMPGGGDLYVQTENVQLSAQLALGHQVAPGRYVKISITDTGEGMDAATLPRIFDPFFTTRGLGRGTGLGLASAYGIVKNHGGFINLYSEKGQGSTFTIHLSAAEAEVKDKFPFKEGIMRGEETVLIVDDEEVVLEVGAGMLRTLGYRVLSASSGKEAIRMVETHGDEIDLVILDLIMPDMNGGQVFDAIQSLAPELKVLLSSGYSVNGEAQKILARGCNGFIQKPFDLAELSRKLRELLNGSGAPTGPS